MRQVPAMALPVPIQPEALSPSRILKAPARRHLPLWRDGRPTSPQIGRTAAMSLENARKFNSLGGTAHQVRADFRIRSGLVRALERTRTDTGRKNTNAPPLTRHKRCGIYSREEPRRR